MKKIDQLKDIVNNHSFKKIDNIYIDVQTASAILSVYDALSNKNKKDYASKKISQMANIAWKLVK